MKQKNINKPHRYVSGMVQRIGKIAAYIPEITVVISKLLFTGNVR